MTLFRHDIIPACFQAAPTWYISVSWPRDLLYISYGVCYGTDIVGLRAILISAFVISAIDSDKTVGDCGGLWGKFAEMMLRIKIITT